MGPHFAQKTTNNPCSLLHCHTPLFRDMYLHKTPPTPPQNTPLPGLNLKKVKMNYCLGNLDPNSMFTILWPNGPNLAGCFKTWITDSRLCTSPTQKLMTHINFFLTRFKHWVTQCLGAGGGKGGQGRAALYLVGAAGQGCHMDSHCHSMTVTAAGTSSLGAAGTCCNRD